MADEVVVRPRPPHTTRPSAGESRSASARPPHRYLWSELMRRVFGVDVLRCTRCGSRRRLVSLITERAVIVRILAHLGLDPDWQDPE